MRITPEQFDTIRNIFFFLILCFFAFVGIQILLIRSRWNQPPPRRPPNPPGPPRPPGTGEYREAAGTFGTSGIGAGDLSSGADFASSSDSSSGFDSGGFDSGGGDSGGGGDFSGGGGDSGGGGSSGSW